MAILPICHFPEDSVLRQKAKRVSSIDGSIQRLIDNMLEIMHQTNGIGLAAPQDVIEACLSVPGYFGKIKWSAFITVKGWNRDGKAIRIKAAGLMAEALEHEIDHLNGIFYVDHVESQDKLHKVET